MEDYFITPQEGGRTRSKSRRKTTSARLTPYQRHIKEFAKTYKGKNMLSAAAKDWKKKSGKTSRKTSRRRTSRKQRGGAENDLESTETSNNNVGMARDDTAALKQILMQRLYGS
jgi:hypothetical protein